jgi:hypothetical protein
MNVEMSDTVLAAALSGMPLASMALNIAIVILSWTKSTMEPSRFLILEIPLVIVILLFSLFQRKPV